MMLQIVVAVIASFYFGFKLGRHAMTKAMRYKKQELLQLIDEAKQKNNDMLSNFSKVAHIASNTEGQWTDVDDFIMPMWME